MEFRPVAELGDDVLVQHHDDLPIVIPATSVDNLRGATLDVRRRHGAAEPEPAAPAGRAIAERPEADLSGEVAHR